MASDHVRSHWDAKYRQGLPSLEKPDPFFVSAFNQFVAGQFPDGGVALDLAGGVGRHALWLATKRWHVTVVDVSAVAIEKLDAQARKLNLQPTLFAMDAMDYEFKPACFDLIVLFYHFDRQTASRVLSALKPGGFVICKSSVLSSPYQGAAPASLQPLKDNEILSLLSGLRVLDHRERPVRDRGVVEYVGQKTAEAGI
jgi:2-polyprenyl-3-methyl-5-hydroxy-6-metoxy-1,4-benzoquinol methylase